jgi:segregation and condensation protein B
MNESHIRNVIEAALLAAGKPLQPAELVQLFDEGARPQVQDIQAVLTSLMGEYSNRGIEIKETAAGYRIQVRRELANEISRLWPERPARYSRALLETLALIAYRQPITRAEIEAVRGVAVNPNIVKTVIERNWVRVVGHRDVPGRPELLGTTREFLDYFGLKNLDELPPLAELKTLGDIKVQFDLPDPGPIGLPDSVDGAAADAVAPADDAQTRSAELGASEVVATDANTAPSASPSGRDIHTASNGSTVTDVVNAESDTPAAANATHSESNTSAVANIAHLESNTSTVANAAASRELSATSVDSEATSIGGGEMLADGVASDAGEPDGLPRSHAAPDSALYEAEEFAASIEAELAAGDDDGSDDGTEDDELSAAGPASGELVAGPRDWDE